jgi:anti-sigma B factor antagonist
VDETLGIQIEHPVMGVRVIKLAGPLTLNTVSDFQQLSRTDAAESVILDLSRVPYADSAGLGALIGLMASCQRHGKGFGVTGTTDRVKTLFRLTRIEGMIRTFTTVDEAVKTLQA